MAQDEQLWYSWVQTICQIIHLSPIIKFFKSLPFQVFLVFHFCANVAYWHSFQKTRLASNLITFISVFYCHLADGTCTTSIQGAALRQHSYKSLITMDILACYYSCKDDEPCQSINFYKTSRLCELNNRISAVSPGDFVLDTDAYYFDNPFRGKYHIDLLFVKYWLEEPKIWLAKHIAYLL